MIIDTHIHADTRNTNDFKEMVKNKLNTAISCSYYPYTLRSQDCLLNLFDRLLEFDTQRAKNEGLDLKIACGIHPNNIQNDNTLIFNELENLAENEKIIAIGEIGLESNTIKEQEILKKQLTLADDYNLPVIIHTPSKNKLNSTKTIVELIEDTIKPELVLIDHANMEIVEYLIDSPYTFGLSIQPSYMLNQFEALKILDKYGFDRFLLNSDMSIFSSSCLTVPNFINFIKLKDYKNIDINKIAYKNAQKFFNIEL